MTGLRPRLAVAVGLVALLTGCAGSAAPTASPAAPAPTTSAPTTSAPGTSAGSPPTPGADWPAYHGDLQHSGYAADLAAPGALSTAWTADLDGVVQASPLVLGDRVLAATENNTVYALDRATGTVLWSRHLGEPVPQSSLPCGNIDPVVGITGTPVYDPASDQLFAVTTTRMDGGVRHTLVGLSPQSGEVRTSTPVDPPGSHPEVQNQRGALGLSPRTGRVLVPYGGHAGDCGDYHGYLVSVLARDGSGATVFRTGTGTEAGMWQPSGIPVDDDGFAYTVSGNGSATSPPYDGSDSVNRVDPATGRSTSFFAPSGWARENAGDLDLGSAGAALVGDLVWIQGKTSTGYLLRAEDLGGIGNPAATVTGACASQFGGAAVHGSAVFAPCTDGLRRIDVRPDASYTLGWRAPGNVTGSPVVGGERVWSLDPRAGRLYSLDEQTGKTVATVDVGQTVRFATPALSGDLLFVPTTTGVTAVSGA